MSSEDIQKMGQVQISTLPLDKKGIGFMVMHVYWSMFMCHGMGGPPRDPVLKHLSPEGPFTSKS